MQPQNVTCRSKRIGYLIILGTTFLAIGVPVLLCPVQQLPRARIGLTGQVTLTMRSTDGIGELLGRPKPGRKIRLSGYEAVTDSYQCHCYAFHPQCVEG